MVVVQKFRLGDGQAKLCDWRVLHSDKKKLALGRLIATIKRI
jgi:hypothetical protein